MPKVTVYIPTHNYARYIKKAVDSILAQKFHDWELIIIDDGSTDNTKNILSRYKNNPKIRVIHQERKGLTVSNNIALRVCGGEYIVRLDGDDYFDENALLVLSNILDSHPEVGLVYPDYYRVNEKGQIIDIERRKKIGKEVSLLDIPAHGACTMIRKKCLLELGGYNENLPCQDGYDLWIRFINKYKPYNVNVPLFYYRQHGASLTKNKERILAARYTAKRDFVKKHFKGFMPKVLAIIPVRKPSGAFPDMPLKKLAARPMLDYTIKEALTTKLLDKVVVVSEDDAIIRHARRFSGIYALRRPADMGLANSSIEPTVQLVLRYLKRKKRYSPDAVMLLYAHTPLRRYLHIEKAIDTMLIFNAESVISVCEDLNIYYQHNRNGLSPLRKKRSLRLERDALYRENSAVYLSRAGVIKSGAFLGRRVGHIVMLEEDSIKVNSEFNFWLAERIVKERQKKKAKNGVIV